MITAHIIERANAIDGEYQMRRGHAMRAAWAYWQGNSPRFQRFAGRKGQEAVKAEFEAADDVLEIQTEWHKANDRHAATYKQVQFLEKLLNERDIEFPWKSNTNAQRMLNKAVASEAIDALLDNRQIIFA
jgi:threonine aldolase